jgi:hypothetical protein
MKICGICSHAERAAIDAALVDGTSIRVISGQYTGVSRSALDRHRKHIPAALVKAKEAAEVADAGTLLSRVEQLVSRCERIYDLAIVAGELSGAVGATRELRGCLELLGKLSGELQNGAKVAINFGDIAKIDIRMLTNDQLVALCERIAPPPGLMSDAKLDAELYEIAFRAGYAKSSVADAYLFDEETVAAPLGGNHICWQYDKTQWRPYRNSSPGDRFQMLQVAWKNITGLELSDKLGMQDLGSRAVITVGFDFADAREENWHTWPKVELLVGKSHEQSPASPAKTIQGVR